MSIDALGECVNTGSQAYTLNVYMVNLGSSARSYSFDVKYFQADGSTLVQTETYGPYNLGPWETDATTIEQGISSNGCSYPHLVHSGQEKAIEWRR